jgi:hypothetical protein
MFTPRRTALALVIAGGALAVIGLALVDPALALAAIGVGLILLGLLAVEVP